MLEVVVSTSLVPEGHPETQFGPFCFCHPFRDTHVCILEAGSHAFEKRERFAKRKRLLWENLPLGLVGFTLGLQLLSWNLIIGLL